jgi:hypothetical protein
MAEGRALPRPEIVETPRSGTLVTHRLFLSMQGVDGTPLSRHAEPDDVARAANRKAAAPAAWAAVPMTPRPCAEPSLNHWLGLTLGDPDALVARVVEQDTGASVAVVSAADLALHPLLLPLLTVGLTGSLFHEIREVSIGLRDGIAGQGEVTRCSRV